MWDVLWRTTLAILILLLGFSSMFVHLFSPDYAQRSDTTAEALMDEPFAGAFDNPFIGMSTLFALLTTENYPQVVYPACPPGSPYCAQLVAFVPVWYLASFVFLAIQTAVIVDKYFLVFKAQMLKERQKERKVRNSDAILRNSARNSQTERQILGG